jgi:uncharacterized PurR-regulated membrane protein YhhQ (DUF165 family)
MMNKIKQGFATFREHLRYHSMKLAAAISAAVFSFIAFVGGNTPLMLAVINNIPGNDAIRFVFALACAVAVYLSIEAVRFWPQPNLDKEKPDGE